MTSPKLAGLIARREFRNMPQHELAKVIDVTQSQLHKFEQGQVRLDVYRASKLARALDCTIDELL